MRTEMIAHLLTVLNQCIVPDSRWFVLPLRVFLFTSLSLVYTSFTDSCPSNSTAGTSDRLVLTHARSAIIIILYSIFKHRWCATALDMERKVLAWKICCRKKGSLVCFFEMTILSSLSIMDSCVRVRLPFGSDHTWNLGVTSTP